MCLNKLCLGPLRAGGGRGRGLRQNNQQRQKAPTHIERAHLVVSSLLHLTVGTPMTAAAKLNNLHGRWAHMILSGRAYLATDKLSRQQIREVKAQRGREPLWNSAITQAICLRQRMMHDDPRFPHTNWARQLRPPSGTWISHVKLQQKRFSIPDMRIPPAHLEISLPQLKLMYKSYRQVIVAPASRAGTLTQPTTPPLPGGWVLAVLTHTPWMQTFMH